MARIELAPEVLGDIDRIFDHLALFDVHEAPDRIGEIIEAIQILSHSPRIGRKVKGGKRELVIGQASFGVRGALSACERARHRVRAGAAEPTGAWVQAAGTLRNGA